MNSQLLKRCACSWSAKDATQAGEKTQALQMAWKRLKHEYGSAETLYSAHSLMTQENGIHTKALSLLFAPLAVKSREEGGAVLGGPVLRAELPCE